MLQGLGEEEGGLLVVFPRLAPRVVLRFRPPGHERDVLEPDAVARTHEDAGQGDRGERVVRGPGVREHFDHLGEPQQAGEADDLGGHATLRERALEGIEEPGGPAQDGDLGPRRAAVVELRHPLRHPPRLVQLVAVRGQRDPARAVGLPGDQPLLRVGALGIGELPDDGVGRLEDRGTRPEVGEQGLARRRTIVGRPEPFRELEEVVERCATPGVDVLVRVPDGGDRVPTAEEGLEEPCLGDVRVLVLVEQDRLEPLAVLAPHVGMLGGDAHRQLDLVAVVDHAELVLEVAEDVRRPGELDPLLGRAVRAFRSMLLQRLEPADAVVDDRLRLHEMVLQLLIELEDVVDDARLPFGLHVVERHLIEHAPRELHALGLREDALSGLDAREHAVAVDDLLRQAVVVQDSGSSPSASSTVASACRTRSRRFSVAFTVKVRHRRFPGNTPA